MLNDYLGDENFLKVAAGITDAELERFRNLLYAEVGITISPSKQHMVTARLSKRLRALKLDTYAEYLNFLTSPTGRLTEIDQFIDVMTTNKTDFFREISHYEVLRKTVLPEMRAFINPREDFVIWSAGCSTGEEPYSLSMLLYDHFLCVPGSYSVLATDICKEALDRAKRAVYANEVADAVPTALATRFLLRGKGRQEGFSRVAPEIRQRVTFKRLNFMDEVFPLDQPVHVIWCRNVMIYFDAPTKMDLISKFSRALVPGGFLFIGHSESLNTLTDEFSSVAPAVYRKLT